MLWVVKNASTCGESNAKKYLKDSWYINVYEQIVMLILTMGTTVETSSKMFSTIFLEDGEPTLAGLQTLAAFRNEIIKHSSFILHKDKTGRVPHPTLYTMYSLSSFSYLP